MSVSKPSQRIFDVISVLVFSFVVVIVTRYYPQDDRSSIVDPTNETEGIAEDESLEQDSEKDQAVRGYYMYEELSLPSHVTRELRKEERRIAKLPLLAMKSPMYDNCELLDPEGTLLAKISLKKASWYISKGLGHWTNEHKHQVLLNFQPKARSSQEYQTSKKENICVVCGSRENHIRFYIVPYVYRSLLPSCYKTHMSHDVVIVCGLCHLQCEKYTQRLMKELEYQCKPAGGYPSKYIMDPTLFHVRTCAMALYHWKNKMPTYKVIQYESVVTNYLLSIQWFTEKAHLTTEDLDIALNVKYQTENPNFIASSTFIVQKLASDSDQVEAFVKRWRHYFIESMAPRYMPIGWTVDHPVRCDQ